MAKNKQAEPEQAPETQDYAERIAGIEAALLELSAECNALASDIHKSGERVSGYRRLAKIKFSLAGLTKNAAAPPKQRSNGADAPQLFKGGTTPASRKIDNPAAPDLFKSKGAAAPTEIKNPAAPNIFKLKGAGSKEKAVTPKKEKAPAPEKGGIILASSEDKDKN